MAMGRRVLAKLVAEKLRGFGVANGTFLRVRGILGVSLAVAILVCPVGCQQRGGRRGDPQFQQARQLAVDGKYDQAIASLQEYVRQNPNSENASRAGLFLFKAHFAQAEFPEAAEWCRWTIRVHPTSLEAHKCRYKLAVLSLVQGDTQEAIKLFDALAEAPDGPLAAEATAMRDYLESVEIQPRGGKGPAEAAQQDAAAP
jgi:TolA-binding protein